MDSNEDYSNFRFKLFTREEIDIAKMMRLFGDKYDNLHIEKFKNENDVQKIANKLTNNNR